ncbi:MAG: hypothetical protein LBC85_07905 [Fibromonadaceae bacterium]|jgi:hypothetical protein|nr:hypothetical protein [Fibromonadaceae bacterium]
MLRPLILTLFLIPAIVFAEKKGKTDVKIEGILEVGIDINNRVDRDETNYNKIGFGKIEVSARPAKRVRAEFGFEYDRRDDVVVVDKLYGQYNFTDSDLIRAGYMKKAFGLEEKAGLDERYFHRRSIINSGLKDLFFLGHDLTLQYRHRFNENWRLIGGFSWSEDKEHYLQNYSIEYGTKNIDLVLATIVNFYTYPERRIIASYTTPKKNTSSFVSSLSFKRTAKLFVSETELTFGLNHEEIYLNDRNAYIFGLRMQEYFPINTGAKTLRQVIPITEAALYSKDMESKNFDAQLRAGLTFGFAKNSAFQWRNTYGAILRIIDSESELTRRRFDSEVVVIF